MTSAPPHLSRFQREIVWHLSQGLSPKETAAALNSDYGAVADSLRLVRQKLGAATTIQAVLYAYVQGCVGVRQDCGTRVGYLRHLKTDEDACPACKAANVRWLERQSRPASPVRPLSDAQLRILHAIYRGRSHADLVQLWQVSPAGLNRAICDMYIRLGVADVPREERRERAFEVALETGLLRSAGPPCTTPVRGPVVKLTDRETEILAAVALGGSLSRIGRALGLPPTSVSSRLSGIYRKLDVAHLPRQDKRAGAVKAARRLGYAV